MIGYHGLFERVSITIPTNVLACLPAMPPKGTKRKLDEHIVESPQLLFPSSCPPQLQLPSGLDIDSPSTLFSLFVSDDIFEFS